MKYLFPEKFLTAKKDEKNFQELSNFHRELFKNV